MPAKERGTARAKRAAIADAFGDVPLDADYVDFLYSRRHLATVQDGRWTELQYIVELDELEHAISTALARIRQRDGKKVFEEVAARLISGISLDVEPRRVAEQVGDKHRRAAAALRC